MTQTISTRDLVQEQSQNRSRVLTLPSIIPAPAVLLLDKPFCLPQMRHLTEGSTSPRGGGYCPALPCQPQRTPYTNDMHDPSKSATRDPQQDPQRCPFYIWKKTAIQKASTLRRVEIYRTKIWYAPG